MKLSSFSKEEVFIQMAITLSQLSTCKERQVGCIITSVDFKHIYSIGYNGNYSKGPNECDNRGHKCGCTHAEINALIKCRSEDRYKAMFITLAPCEDCAKAIINSGAIASVYYMNDWKDNPGIKILTESKFNISCKKVNPFKSMEDIYAKNINSII